MTVLSNGSGSANDLMQGMPGRARLTPWSVYAWPALVRRVHAAPDWQMIHLTTCVATRQEVNRAFTGQTLWGSELGGAAAALAWDWIWLGPGVVALADPMGLVTNVRLVDDQGEPLSSLAVALHLNQLVHSLPWQTEVQRALGATELN